MQPKTTYSGRDGDPSGLLLGRLVDLRVVHELSTALLGEVLGDGGGKGGLSVIDVLQVSQTRISGRREMLRG
jgi:hypothetical protein